MFRLLRARPKREELTEEERERRRNLQAEAARKRQMASGVRKDKKKAKKNIDPSKVGMNKSIELHARVASIVMELLLPWLSLVS